MIQTKNPTVRAIIAFPAVAALAASAAGCNEDEAARAFRDAAADSLQQGFQAISSGLIEGAFAVFTLGPDDPADGTGSGGTDGGGAGGESAGGESSGG